MAPDFDSKSDRSDKLKVTASGSGGITELKDKLDDGKASFAYVRVQYSNDKEVQLFRELQVSTC